LRVLVKRVFDGFAAEFCSMRRKDVHEKVFGRTIDLFDKEESLFLRTFEEESRSGSTGGTTVCSARTVVCSSERCPWSGQFHG